MILLLGYTLSMAQAPVEENGRLHVKDSIYIIKKGKRYNSQASVWDGTTGGDIISMPVLSIELHRNGKQALYGVPLE